MEFVINQNNYKTNDEKKIKFVICKNNIKICDTYAFIGKNGLTRNKREGDQKTPIGKFLLGIMFGMHNIKDAHIPLNAKYLQINSNLYWVDDVNSLYYNQLVNIIDVKKDWESAEHLIEYLKQYEYAIEIKSNPENIPGKRERNIFALQYRETNNGVYSN